MKLPALLLFVSLTAFMSMPSPVKQVNAAGQHYLSFPKNFYQLPVTKPAQVGYVKITPECFSILVTNPGTVTTHLTYLNCDSIPGEYFIQPGDTISTECMDFYMTGDIRFDGPFTIINMTNCAL
jgi:hypothetical protein